MPVAALFDIHANLPALEAVIEDARQAGADRFVAGGDVIPGPMPAETLRYLLGLDLPVHFIHGNGELAILARMAAGEDGEVSYWGTVTGEPPPERYRGIDRWTCRSLHPDHEAVLAGWPRTVRLTIPELGEVLFCHATPRSETEVFTRVTPEARLRPVFDGLNVPVVVCGHTHMQFDRMIGGTRVVNAGSVGMPYGDPRACWVLLGPDVRLMQTAYDRAEAARRIRATTYPDAENAARDLLNPPTESAVLEAFEKLAIP